MTRYLCEIIGVSRSGYYAWIKNTEKHAIREDQDYENYLLLGCIYEVFKGKVGYRKLYMKLTELMVVPMNHKKLRGLMGKYNFFAKIRCTKSRRRARESLLN